jgi:hypothetical protein
MIVALFGTFANIDPNSLQFYATKFKQISDFQKFMQTAIFLTTCAIGSIISGIAIDTIGYNVTLFILNIFMIAG